MEKNYFSKNFFENLSTLTDDDQKKLLELTTLKKIPNNTQLIKVGDSTPEIGFMIEGIVRVFDEDDRTVMFVSEGQVYGSKESLVLNQTSKFNFETIEDSVIFIINNQDLEATFYTHPNIAYMLLNYWKITAMTIFQNFHTFIRNTPEERYEHLIKNYPQLVLRVKSKHLASYLGIHPASLSRLKKRYFKSTDK